MRQIEDYENGVVVLAAMFGTRLQFQYLYSMCTIGYVHSCASRTDLPLYPVGHRVSTPYRREELSMLAEILAAANSLRTAGQIAAGLINLKTTIEVQAKAIELNQLILSAQTDLFAANAAQMRDFPFWTHPIS